MYTKEEYEEKLNDPIFVKESKSFVEKKRFERWLGRLYSLTKELDKEYNLFYNLLYITVLYEFVVSGKEYIERVIGDTTNAYLKAWFNRIDEAIESVKDIYTDDEFAYFEYRRNNACHIFVNGYDTLQNDGKIKVHRKITTKNGEKIVANLIDIDLFIYDILKEYGGPAVGDKNFDIAKQKLASPIIHNMMAGINSIAEKEYFRQPL